MQRFYDSHLFNASMPSMANNTHLAQSGSLESREGGMGGGNDFQYYELDQLLNSKHFLSYFSQNETDEFVLRNIYNPKLVALFYAQIEIIETISQLFAYFKFQPDASSNMSKAQVSKQKQNMTQYASQVFESILNVVRSEIAMLDTNMFVAGDVLSFLLKNKEMRDISWVLFNFIIKGSLEEEEFDFDQFHFEAENATADTPFQQQEDKKRDEAKNKQRDDQQEQGDENDSPVRSKDLLAALHSPFYSVSIEKMSLFASQRSTAARTVHVSPLRSEEGHRQEGKGEEEGDTASSREGAREGVLGDDNMVIELLAYLQDQYEEHERQFRSL